MIELEAFRCRCEQVKPGDALVDFGDKRRLGGYVVGANRKKRAPSFDVVGRIVPIALRLDCKRGQERRFGLAGSANAHGVRVIGRHGHAWSKMPTGIETRPACRSAR